VINRTGSEEIQLGAMFNDPTTVSDNYWPSGTITFSHTGEVKTNIPGTYTVVYNATDPSGNVAATVTRNYKVSDFVKPVINTLAGSEVMIVDVNDVKFEEPEVRAVDNNGSAKITRTGSYDITKLGTYQITYTAEDAFKNTTTWVRTIIVADQKAPSCIGDLVNVDRWTAFDPYSSGAIQVIDNYYPQEDFIDGKNGCKIVIIANTVNPSVDGLYKVIFQAVDGSGNTSSPCISFVQVNNLTTSVAGVDFSGNVHIYPNPSQGEFTVSVDRLLSSDARISIVNILGAEVASYSSSSFVNGRLVVDLKHMDAGVYLVNIYDKEQRAVKKITITK
jgi:hypothetical protein